MANTAYTSELKRIGLRAGRYAVYVVQPLHR
jgi:hypothetical protein